MSNISESELREKASEADRILAALYPDAACSLQHADNPWRLLVMARLSAQCTDARVNLVCRDLFAAIPDVAAMASAPRETIESYIRSCGLYHSKAKSLQESAVILLEKYGGRVPNTMDELLALPGVGRKIANLILGDVYGRGGIVADTHCIRICGRLGFYPESNKDPVRTERIMAALIPTERQSAFCHRIVHFGRDRCTARSPACADCPMSAICAHFANAACKQG